MCHRKPIRIRFHRLLGQIQHEQVKFAGYLLAFNEWIRNYEIHISTYFHKFEVEPLAEPVQFSSEPINVCLKHIASVDSIIDCKGLPAK